MAFRFSVACALLLALGASPAQAERPFTIAKWSAPESLAKACRDPGHFERRVNSDLGPDASAEVPVEVEIQIVRRGRQFTLQMITHAAGAEQAGARTIRGRSCRELVETAAVILSLALDPSLLFVNERAPEETSEALAETGPSRDAGASRDGSQAFDSETPLTPRGERARARSETILGGPLDVGLRLAALSDLGTLPRPGLGVALVASARSSSFRLSFRLTRWAQQRGFVRSGAPEGGRFDYLSGGLHLCLDLWSGRIPGGACAIATLGRLSADGVALDLPRSQAHLMANLAGATYIEQPSGLGTFRVQLELGAPLVRPRYTVKLDSDVMEVHKPDWLNARVSASWGLSF